MVKFQYISDIHLEFLKKIPKIEKLANNLCLLGDIGHPTSKIYNQFIKECSLNYKNVFLLYGNHCYYSKTNTMTELEELTKSFPDNVYFLNNKRVFIDKNDNVYDNVTDNVDKDNDKEKNVIKIIGATLWSDIKYDISYYINDYYMIKTDSGKLTPYESSELFRQSKKFILDELNNDTTKTILLTHHGANDICNSIHYKDSPLKSAFVTNIPELLEFKHLYACINGHTHASINEEINNIKFLSNCYGYPNENKKIVNYNKDAILEIQDF